MHMLAYGGYISLMISFGTLLMYMGVVHGVHILVHDVLGRYIIHDSLFHWWHIFCFMMNGMAQVWCMNRSKDRHLVAYCSSCREDRGRHTLRGSHSSSHDSRRRYLSDTYLEKRPIFEERSTRGIIPGGAMVTWGVCSMYLQNYIRVISFVQKGRDY